MSSFISAFWLLTLALSLRFDLFNVEISHLYLEHPTHELALWGKDVAVEDEGDDIETGVLGVASINSWKEGAKDEGVESGVLSAVSVEAEGEAVVMGVLGAVSVCSWKDGAVEGEGESVEIGLLATVCIAVEAEGEAVVMGVLGAVSVCSWKEGAVEAEGEGVQIGVLGAVSVCITVGAEGEGVEQGVLCAVSVCCIGVVALPLAFFALFALYSS